MERVRSTLSQSKIIAVTKRPWAGLLLRALLFPVLLMPVLATDASASTGSADLSVICDQAASFAAAKTDVPLAVLQAISLNETGRRRNGKMRPWPWTVNMEGKGVWFQTEDAARAFVYKNYKRGARSFDIGCFQINFKWHGHAFASIEEMFDPKVNALYAARYLMDLYQEKGSWGAAAGAYHSRTPKLARKYQKRFEAYRTALAGPASGKLPVLPVKEPAARVMREAPRINRYPLLQAGGASRGLGSLVPISGNQPVRVIGMTPRDG